MNEIMTDKEAAAFMRMAPKTGHEVVQRYVRQGKLKALRVGNRYRFRKEDLLDFMEMKQEDR